MTKKRKTHSVYQTKTETHGIKTSPWHSFICEKKDSHNIKSSSCWYRQCNNHQTETNKHDSIRYNFLSWDRLQHHKTIPDIHLLLLVSDNRINTHPNIQRDFHILNKKSKTSLCIWSCTITYDNSKRFNASQWCMHILCIYVLFSIKILFCDNTALKKA